MKTLALLTGAALIFSGGAALAQTSDMGQDASQAQLQREHNRAVKAGDAANDPMDSSSSDALNQQQLQGTPISGGGDAGGPTTAPTTPDMSTSPRTPGADSGMTPDQPPATDNDGSASDSSSSDSTTTPASSDSSSAM
jgi:hypothetical protein